MGKLDGQIAIITGGASGIGKAAVKLFVSEGAKVVIGDVQEELCQKLIKEVGNDASFKYTNVGQEEDMQSLVSSAVDKHGRLDCIFNNAAIGGASGPIDEIPMVGYDVTMAVNLRSVFMGMKFAAAVMKEQMSGSIISTASIAGQRTGFGGHVYSACKAAIIQMTRTVAVELGPFNIRTNCICPGGIVTSIFGRGLGLSQEDSEASYDGISDIFKNLQALPRAGTPEDIAKTALWLATEDSSFVNGAAINVDGAVPDGMPVIEGFTEKVGDVLGVDIPVRPKPER